IVSHNLCFRRITYVEDTWRDLNSKGERSCSGDIRSELLKESCSMLLQLIMIETHASMLNASFLWRRPSRTLWGFPGGRYFWSAWLLCCTILAKLTSPRPLCKSMAR